jgi:predicted secreted Zn-dependent protease
MKNIYKIDYDGMYSSIQEVSPINDWSGNPIIIDDYEYFSTKAKAKKQLIKELSDRMNNLKWAIQNIKKTY